MKKEEFSEGFKRDLPAFACLQYRDGVDLASRNNIWLMKQKSYLTIVLHAGSNTSESTLLNQSIAHILQQSFANFELLVLAKNRSDFIHAKRQQNYGPKVRFETIKVSNPFDAYNTALKRSNAKYICFVDSSSLFDRAKLKVQIDFLESHPKVGAVGSAVEIFDTSSKSTKRFVPIGSYRMLRAFLFFQNCMWLPSMVFRRCFLERFELTFNPQLREAADYDFFVKCCNCFPIRNLDRTLLRYVKTGGSRVSRNALPRKRDYQNRVKIGNLKSFSILPSTDEERLHVKLVQHNYLTTTELDEARNWLDRLRKANDKLKMFNAACFSGVLESILHGTQLGGWAIERELVTFMTGQFPAGAVILEFGSGIGTEALLKTFKVISIEHDAEFAFNRPGSHRCLFAPIVNNWYKRSIVRRAIGERYDAILIDGPPQGLRKGILNNLDLFKNSQVPIIFDDVDRSLDREIMVKFCDEVRYAYEIYKGKNKEFAFCYKS